MSGYQTYLPPAGSIGTAQIADGAVTTPKLADGAVTGAKIVQTGTLDIGATSITTTGELTTRLIKSNAGSPEGVVTASPSAICRDTTNGRLYLKRSGTGNTGWVQIDRCESGTYTPTGTIVTNLDSVTPGLFFYQRVGDVVSGWGPVTYDPTAGSSCSFALSLPIASNFAAATDAAGVSNRATGEIAADSTNDRLSVLMSSNASTASTTAYFSFAYRML